MTLSQQGQAVSQQCLISRLIVVAQPGGILAPQTQHMRPNNTLVASHFVHDFIQRTRLICLGKQAMRRLFFHAGPHPHIPDKLSPADDLIGILFHDGADEFRGAFSVWLLLIFRVLR